MNKLLIGGIAIAAVLSMTFAVQQSRKAALVAVAPKAAIAATGATRKVLYWKAPDGSNDFSAEPKKAADGREYVAVYDDQELDRVTPAPAAPPRGKGKLLYYRNPMGLADTSPTPKKDWMGMDYIAVHEGDDDGGSAVKVSLDKVQRSGVRTAPVEMRRFVRPVRAPGVVRVDERRLYVMTLRADGYVERLYANETGRLVTTGQPLFQFFSPQIISAGIDYETSVRTASSRSRADAEGLRRIFEQRLRNLDVPPAVVAELLAKGRMPERFDMPSPVGGVILEKKVIEGMRMKAGDELYRIADLSTVWVIAEVAEQDLASVSIGRMATMTLRALPNEMVTGRVTFISPELDRGTRTAKVRIEVANPDGRLRAEMFADVMLDGSDGETDRLQVPLSALIDSGNRQVVLIERGEGRYEPRVVKVGVRGDGYVEIIEGVKAGEMVVVTATFLIDAESNLKAALQAFTAEPATKVEAKPLPEGSK